MLSQKFCNYFLTNLRASTKAYVSNFGASNLGPHQFPFVDCLVNTENGYAYWKQVAFSLLDRSVTAKPQKREWLFLNFLVSN